MNSQSSEKISVTTATIVSMNAMIGSGIFTAPAAMAAYVGPAGILAYVFVVVAVWFIAQSLARLAQLFPEEGSFYVYAKQWGGHTMGLIASSAYFIGLLIAMGLLSQMAGLYLVHFFPSLSAYTLGIITLALLVILNMFGAVLSSFGQHVLIVCTLFPLLAITALCLTKFNASYLTPFAPYGFENVLKATRIVIFGFFGFESASSLFNIVQNPSKNVPRALTYSIMAVGTIYTLFIASIILSTPLNLFTDPRVPVSETLAVIFPEHPWLLNIIHFAILSAIIGTIHSMIWGSSNLLTLLIKRCNNARLTKLFCSSATQHNSASVIAVGIAIFISYITLTSLNLFFCLTALCIVFAYVSAMIALLTIPSEWKSGRNIITVLGIITALLIFTFAAQGLLEQFGIY